MSYILGAKKPRRDSIVKQEISPLGSSAAPKNSFVPSTQVVETVNNRIYFYADITRENILKLTKSLMDLDSQQISQALLNTDKEFRSVWLHINSYGGFVFDGLAAMDQIAMTRCPVFTVVDGVAASAATLMSIRGRRRYIKPSSFMLIHQITSSMWGKYDEFIDEMENLQKFMSILKSIYLKHTNIKSKDLDLILKRDLYFTAKECVKYGLVDEILK